MGLCYANDCCEFVMKIIHTLPGVEIYFNSSAFVSLHTFVNAAPKYNISAA